MHLRYIVRSLVSRTRVQTQCPVPVRSFWSACRLAGRFESVLVNKIADFHCFFRDIKNGLKISVHPNTNPDYIHQGAIYFRER